MVTIRSMEEQVLRASKRLWIIASDADQARDLIRRGYRYLAVPLTGLIVAGGKELGCEARPGPVLPRPLAAGKR